jgi:NAD(P)-dependent dehydrogenase (short-subunit alcohol dehydrogenase family)
MAKKVALITGGATGIGKATAAILGQRGAKVVITGRRTEIGEQAVHELRSQGGDVAFLPGDVSDEEQVQAMVDFAVRTFGQLDLAVNNAGLANESKRIGDAEPALFQAMLQTNVFGLYLCMKYEIAQMQRNGGGTIVNLGYFPVKK